MGLPRRGRHVRRHRRQAVPRLLAGGAGAFAYSAEYSCDGGNNWLQSNCRNTERSCQIDRLPAGTACSFRVFSEGGGGKGAPSEIAVTLTDDSPDSKECREKLLAQVEGNYLSPGTTAGIVIGVIVGLIIILAAVWYFMCRKPKKLPPPPPGGAQGIPPPPPSGQQYGGYS